MATAPVGGRLLAGSQTLLAVGDPVPCPRARVGQDSTTLLREAAKGA